MIAAAFAAGVINSIAGGGTLITFPVLMWLGLDPKVANATSTVALWPGLFGGLFGYRKELEKKEKLHRGQLMAFNVQRRMAEAVPSMVGSFVE